MDQWRQESRPSSFSGLTKGGGHRSGNDSSSSRAAVADSSSSSPKRPTSASGRPRSGGAIPGSIPSQLSTLSFEAEMNDLLDSVLSEADIASALGYNSNVTDLDFSMVRRIRLCLDTNKKSVSELGRMLPSLEELVLDGSRIASIRDLGTDLKCLRVLSLNDCNLYDLEGVSSLLFLEELYLRNNAITDLVALTMHDNLKVLDLQSNRICDLSGADALSSCGRLDSVSLAQNPIERCPNYRAVISLLIPQLSVLDGSPVDRAAEAGVTNAMILEASAYLRGLQESIDDEQRLEDNMMGSHSPKTERARGKILQTENTTSAAALNTSIDGADTGSELTHGSSVVLAGGVAAAMRRRRADRNRAESGSADYSEPMAVPKSASGSSETLSALMVLDAALEDDRSRILNSRGNIQPSATDDVLGSIVADGDLTVSVLGHQPSSKSSVRASNESIAEEDDIGVGENLFDYLKSSNFRRAESSKLPPGKAARNDGKTARDLDSSGQGRPLRTAPELLRDRSGSFRESLSRMSQDSRPASSSGRPSTASSFGDSDGQDCADLSSDAVMAAQPAPFLVVKSVEAPTVPSNVRKSENQFNETTNVSVSNKPLIGIAASVGPGSKHKQAPTSIVHLDVVKRRVRSTANVSGESSSDDDVEVRKGSRSSKLPARTGIFPSYSNIIDSGDDDDDEDICVDHTSRHRMMVSRGKSKQALDSKPSTSKTSGRPPIIPSSKETLSSIAGGTLGFDLSGSLAAINRWVEEDGEVGAAEEARQESSESIGSRSIRGVVNPEADVLSRQKIYSMCQGASPAGSRIDPESDGEENIHEIVFEDDANGFGSGARYMSEPDDDCVIEMKASMSPKAAKSSSQNAGATAPRESATSKKSKLRDAEHVAPVDSSIMGKRALRTMRKEEDDDENDLSDLHDLDRLYAENDRMFQLDHQVSVDRSRHVAESKNSASANASRSSIIATRKVVGTSPEGPASSTESAMRGQQGTGDERPVAAIRVDDHLESSSGLGKGPGVSLSDAELVEMLNRPPKLIHELRTKSHFQDFFRGMKHSRMVALLEQAYASELNPESRRKKVEKRLDLVRDVLV